MARRKRNPGRATDIPDRVARALLAAARLVAFDPRNLRELHAAVVGDMPPRRNPIHLHAGADPDLQEVSERFHGTPSEVAVLDADQRKPPPREVVVIGQEVSSVYRPDRHSYRGDTTWEHEAGDAGEGRPRAPGRGYWVTDGKRRWWVPGTSAAEFDPDRGMVR